MEITGILIDPFARRVTRKTFEYQSYKDIASLIGSQFVDIVALPQGDAIFVDDEGLLGDLDKQMFFRFGSYHSPLAGKGIILGSDAMGETTPKPYMSLEVASSMTYFIGGVHQVRALFNSI